MGPVEIFAILLVLVVIGFFIGVGGIGEAFI
jgi:hypothetical protein